jgi:hypothetical protein
LPTGLRCLASRSRCLHSDAGAAHHVCADRPRSVGHERPRDSRAEWIARPSA